MLKESYVTPDSQLGAQYLHRDLNSALCDQSENTLSTKPPVQSDGLVSVVNEISSEDRLIDTSFSTTVFRFMRL
jgi:hypothetical protein